MQQEVVNPLQEFRLAQNHGKGWSLDNTAQQLGVSISTIVRTEQGCYNEIPPAILRGIAPFFDSPGSVCSQYYRYQMGKRMSAFASKRVRLDLSVVRQLTREDPRNPVIIWREYLGYKSRLAFCKELCIHPSTMKRLEDGLALNIPDSIYKVLENGNLPVFDLDVLYQTWHMTRKR